MKENLKDKIIKVIEDNFKTTESAVFVSLIKDTEKIREENKVLLTRIEKIEEDYEKLRKEKDTLKNEVDSLRELLLIAEKDNKTLQKELLESNAKAKGECLEKIFELTKIVFKTPAKIREFDSPVTIQTTTTEYDNNGNYRTVPTGSCAQTIKCTEKEEVE